MPTIAKIDGIPWASIAKFNGIAVASISKIDGMTASSVDADFASYLAAGVANGSTMSASNQTAVNAFIVGCKTDSIWTPIKASCLLCAWDSLAGALTPMVGAAPTNNNFVSGDYSRTAGLLGNGTTKYLNTNRTSVADSQNDNSMGVWITAAGTDVRAFMGYGSATSTGTTHLFHNSTSQGRNKNATSVIGPARSTGFLGTSRSSSSSFTLRAGEANTASGTRTSGTPTTVDIYVFGRNSGGINIATDGRMSFYYAGSSLTQSLLNARLATLMAALT